jgi:hypothetical protein
MSVRRRAVRRRGGRIALAAVLGCLAVVGALLLVTGRPGTGSAKAEAVPPVVAAAVSPSASVSSPLGSPAAPTAASASVTPPGSASPVPGPGHRTLTLVNALQQTIWPAVAADPAHPVEATGWVLPPGASRTLLIPDHWDVRVWARTGCSFDTSGHGHCVTGDCQGRFQCGSTWGQFPSTLAEFNLNSYQGMDFFDVSLVEGNNLPMWINHSGGRTPDPIGANGCAPAGCTRDANASCPPPLQRTVGGQVVACLSACLAIGGDQTCCHGQWSSRAACDPAKWPVNSAAVFKKAEPFAYSYVNDDATSVFTCSGECDYRITWGVSP